MVKLLILLMLIGIIASLGSALFYLMRDHGGSDRTVRALTVRIGLSIGLFGMLFLLQWLGFIKPHGL